jgi:hypothetical protein
MPPAGFESAIPASEWPQTHALDYAATGIGELFLVEMEIKQTKMIIRIVN